MSKITPNDIIIFWLIFCSKIVSSLYKNKQALDERQNSRVHVDGDASDKDTRWNKEVRHLDARIADVLDKIKEREASLETNNSDAMSPSIAPPLRQVSAWTQTSPPATTTTVGGGYGGELGDELAKVLMSKEEVIGQLEKQARERDTHVQALTEQVTQLADECVAGSQWRTRASELEAQLRATRDQLEQTRALVHSLRLEASETSDEQCRLVSMHEHATGEVETLQEECKTLEYKLAHVHRQALDYQTIIEEVEAANAEMLKQAASASASSSSTSNAGSNEPNGNESLHARIKRTQSNVHALVQALSEATRASGEQVRALSAELDEVRAENADLNQHIFAIDVYMRDKETQCDELQRDKDQLLEQLRSLQPTSRSHTHVNADDDDDDDENVVATSNNKSVYAGWMRQLARLFASAPGARFDEFARVLFTLVRHVWLLAPVDMLDHHEEQVDQDERDEVTGTLGQLVAAVCERRCALVDALELRRTICCRDDDEYNDDEAHFTKSNGSPPSSYERINEKFGTYHLTHYLFKSIWKDLFCYFVFVCCCCCCILCAVCMKQCIESLAQLVDSTEMTNYNQQIVSYISEQLIHKAALGGQLKFACELVRRRSEQHLLGGGGGGQQASDAPLSVAGSSTTTATTAAAATTASMGSRAELAMAPKDAQDEKIFRLASELLLSEQDAVRKLSTSMLNEAQHLSQLGVVVNTLRKMRHSSTKRTINELLARVKSATDVTHKTANGSESQQQQEETVVRRRPEFAPEQLDVILKGFIWLS